MLATLPHGSRIAKKRGVFQYRRRLPGRALGEVAVSLRTRDLREAEHLAGILDGAFPDAWNRAVSEAEDGGDLNASLRRLMNAMVTADLARRFEAASRGEPLFPADDVAFFRRARAWARQNINTSAVPDMVAGPVEYLTERHPEQEPWSLRIAAWEALIRAMEKMEAFALGQRPIIFDEPDPPRAAPPLVVSAAPPPPPPAPAKPLASVLLHPPSDDPEKRSPYFAWRATQKDATEQVMNQERGVFRRFLEHCGDRPVDAYRRADITGFLDVYMRLPRHHGKAPRDKHRSLTEIIAEADRKGAARLKEKTVKARMSALSQFFKRCWNLGYITKPDLDELVAGHEFQIYTAARDQRDAWRSDEIVRLLNSPVYTGCASAVRWRPGPVIIRDSRFWLPLLALFHGARMEEFADLRRADFGCDAGVWFFDFREGEDRRSGKRDQEGRRAQDRRLKNNAAPRVVPLHPELVRLGFLRYVEATASNPGDPLFPDLPPQGPDRRRGPRFTRWFVLYRRRIGVFREGVGMHAFRHTANTRLRNAMTTEQHRRQIDYMLGHTAEGGGEGATRYDKGPGLRAAAETLAKLAYPELDLSRFYVGV